MYTDLQEKQQVDRILFPIRGRNAAPKKRGFSPGGFMVYLPCSVMPSAASGAGSARSAEGRRGRKDMNADTNRERPGADRLFRLSL